METNIRLKLIREEEKLSQIQFAKRLNMSQQAYAPYEKEGNRKYKSDLLIKIYEEFNVNPLWLLTGQGEKRTTEKFDIPNITLKLVSEVIKVDPYFDQLLKERILEKSFEILYADKKTIFSKLKRVFIPNNRRAYFFIKILSSINIANTIKTTYKDYLLDTIKNFKPTIIYTKSDKADLIEAINKLDETSCKYIYQNIDLSIQKNKDQIDNLTRVIEENFIRLPFK